MLLLLAPLLLGGCKTLNHGKDAAIVELQAGWQTVEGFDPEEDERGGAVLTAGFYDARGIRTQMVASVAHGTQRSFDSTISAYSMAHVGWSIGFDWRWFGIESGLTLTLPIFEGLAVAPSMILRTGDLTVLWLELSLLPTGHLFGAHFASFELKVRYIPVEFSVGVGVAGPWIIDPSNFSGLTTDFDNDDETSLFVDGRVWVTPTIAIAGSLQFGDHTAATLGVAINLMGDAPPDDAPLVP